MAMSRERLEGRAVERYVDFWVICILSRQGQAQNIHLRDRHASTCVCAQYRRLGVSSVPSDMR